MRYLVIFTLALLYLIISAASPAYFSAEEDLIAYYSFNNCDARDESGNDSHGQLFGGISCWCGIDDDGLLLDGVNDYITFSGIVNRYFSTSDFTVSFYVKAEQYTVFQQSLLSKRSDCEKNNMLDVLLDMHRRTIIPEVHETPEKYYPNLPTRMDSTSWVHFVLVREGTRAYTYMNGQLMQKGFRCSGVDIANDAILSFSNSPCIRNGNVRYFRGVLDELRVYSRALSEEEVQSLYLLFPVENANMDCFT
jgi:hypothetical protein